MDKIFKKETCIRDVIISSIIVFIYFYTIMGLSDRAVVSNIILYGGAIFVFLITYLLSSFIINRDKYENSVALVVLCLGLFWIIKAFFEEVKPNPNFTVGYLRHNMPIALYFTILIFAGGIVFKFICSNTEMGGIFRISIGAIFVIMETIFLYAPNIYNDTSGGVYHANAYCNSIVNVLNKTPYEYWTTGIYGHYGLLYYFPIKLLKLFGVNQWSAITSCIAFFGCICFVSETLLLHKIIKNDFMFALAVIANALINTQIYVGEYWQVNPHRLLFPAIILLTSYYYYKCNDGKMRYALWILGLLSLLWNLETGIICLFVCLIVCVLKNWNSCKRIDYLVIVKYFFCFMMMGVIAILIVNVYNKICGGGWVSIKEFAYPMGSDEYNVEGLRLPLGTPFIPHFLVIILLLGTICCNLNNIFNFTLEINQLMQVLSSIMGLGVITYYMNRAVNSNMSIVAFEFVMVLSMLIDNNVEIIKKIKVRSLAVPQALCILGILILTSMNLSTIGSVGKAISTYYAGNYNTENLETMLESIEEIIPKEGQVAVVGAGAAVLSSMLDMDNGIHMIDFEDLNPQGKEYLMNEISSHKWDYILIHESNIEYIPDEYQFLAENSGYKLFECTEKDQL